MFIRQKKNSTGSISVQVIDKSRGRYCVLKTIGSSSDKAVIKNFVVQGKQYILTLTKQSSLDLLFGDDTHFYNSERQLKEKKSTLSPEKIIDILKNIYGINLKLPQSQQTKLMLLDKTQEQKDALTLFKIA